MNAHRAVVHRWLAVLLSCLLGLLGACRKPVPEGEYVARVGSSYLTREDVSRALQAIPLPEDSADVRRQVVEQWVTNELLFQEAQRRSLRSRAEVQRRLEESERSVLIDAVIADLYAEAPPSISTADVRAYFEQNRERMKLREPFVRVRHLWTAHPDSAEAALRVLRSARAADTDDSLWVQIANRYAAAPEHALASDQNYLPESQIFSEQPALRATLNRLNEGEVSVVVPLDSTFHVVHLVDQVPAGTLPELSWVQDEIVHLMSIEARKQMYQRQVQRLRTEAQARGEIDVR